MSQMPVNNRITLFVIAGVLVAIGIFGKRFETRKLKISKLSKFSQILAVTGGVICLFLAICTGDQYKKPYPSSEPSYKEAKATVEEPASEKAPAPIESAKSNPLPPVVTPYEESSQPSEPPYKETQVPVDAPPYEKAP